MPSRNIIKQYVENGFYHVYNRGVEKRNIFLDDQDYRVFLHLLKYYLSEQTKNDQKQHPLANLILTGFNPVRLRPLQNLKNEVILLAYCLMPNHFHLLIQQLTLDGMTKLLRRLLTTYSMYFNSRYKRVGHLFQGAFKAALIQEDSYLLHLSRYIHLNPKELSNKGFNPVNSPYSSYNYYLGNKSADWIKPKIILDYFDSTNLLIPKEINSYKKFIEDYAGNSEELLGKFALDNADTISDKV
ncbi:hypothetical protein COT44_02085 [Candidatus Shapirobacteria bacterium CG08_land_8_20_14_0_20_39_18]|uniref:Transposase IS200-like domain-containing protein n=1 Tax=Candidatus Shapirobacteria bacterium CG08_land_8_20_14_0_20_39_18 TaxID=1974883 RepID=A0A2M6XDG0_9BACT|nr:MAG: hypothetical protein COT44_02085 [Candidatus Shapirobacteria bacterium CG08_land_8_20_14_0_20_39_18]PIY66030.1 MAG: hypothetical protein COY91_00985 [Candidatus Shapirobacteria bacterium CG_4_10_14_0_8_um_filter_39_15]PJE68177.1 MAG: hypothetical protein COU94_03240 [Candidatus Shapirobacteria bacterium CG10_big_fil_rev_8_21_14_0_10_38_8]